MAWLDAYYRDVYAPRRARWISDAYRDIMARRAAAQVDFIAAHWSTPLDAVTALEPGCGIGALTAALAARGARASGFDGDRLIIEAGRRAFPEADLRHANLGDANLGDIGAPAALDLIVMSHVVEHMVAVADALSDIGKRLRPGGTMFIEVPNTTPEQFDRAMDMESHVHFFTPASLSALLARAGLVVEACQSCGPPFARLLAHPEGAAASVLFGDDYATYHDTGNGIWIRALARVPQAGRP